MQKKSWTGCWNWPRWPAIKWRWLKRRCHFYDRGPNLHGLTYARWFLWAMCPSLAGQKNREGQGSFSENFYDIPIVSHCCITIPQSHLIPIIGVLHLLHFAKSFLQRPWNWSAGKKLSPGAPGQSWDKEHMSNRQNKRKTKVVGSGHGMFKFVRNHSPTLAMSIVSSK